MGEWDDARLAVAEAITSIKAAERTKGAAGTTLSSSIAEAIYALDSSQVDPVTGLQEGTVEFREANTRVKRGRLQRIQDMKKLYFGSTGNNGLFSRLKKLPPPEYDQK